MKIKIIQNCYDKDVNLYDTDNIELKPGLNILIGRNGSGKTTLLRQIKKHCHNKKIACLSYDNYHEGGTTAMEAATFVGNIQKVVNDFVSSEGERIISNIGDFAAKVGNTVRELKPNQKLFILLDAVDSGLSIDKIIEMKEDFFKLVIEDCKNKDVEVYIVASANEFELAYGERAINVTDGKVYNNLTYEEYKKIILSSIKR